MGTAEQKVRGSHSYNNRMVPYYLVPYVFVWYGTVWYGTVWFGAVLYVISFLKVIYWKLTVPVLLSWKSVFPRILNLCREHTTKYSP